MFALKSCSKMVGGLANASLNSSKWINSRGVQSLANSLANKKSSQSFSPKIQFNRKSHFLSDLPYDPDLGLDPVLSPKALRLIYSDFEKHWVDSLNKMTTGSKYEGLTLEKTIKATSQSLEDKVVYNTASQVWNSSFALKSLSKEPVDINPAISKAITSHFGSYEKMVEEFQTMSTALFGGGYIWLVSTQNKLKVIITTNAESPLYSYSPKREGDIVNPPELQSNPLIGINLWGYSYILDYGLDRATYIERCLSHVDWATVYKRYQSNSFSQSRVSLNTVWNTRNSA